MAGLSRADDCPTLVVQDLADAVGNWAFNTLNAALLMRCKPNVQLLELCK